MKLTRKQVNEIKEALKNGVKSKELELKYNVSQSLINYYSNDERRKQRIKDIILKFKKLSKQQRQVIYRRRREYTKNYNRRKYKEDPIFREKQKKRARECNRKRIKLNKMEV